MTFTFVVMKPKSSDKAFYDSDTITYVLLGIILVVVLLGGMKIIFF